MGRLVRRFTRRRRMGPHAIITTSQEVLDGLPVTVVVAWDTGWMLLSAREDGGGPVAVHLGDVAATSPSLYSLALRTGEYAVRGEHTHDSWDIYGPMPLDAIDADLSSGAIAAKVQKLSE